MSSSAEHDLMRNHGGTWQEGQMNRVFILPLLNKLKDVLNISEGTQPPISEPDIGFELKFRISLTSRQALIRTTFMNQVLEN